MLMKLVTLGSMYLFHSLIKALWACLLYCVWQNKYLKDTLHSALRREKMAETEIRSLKAEIEHLNRLV